MNGYNTKEYSAIKLSANRGVLNLRINRPEANNSINEALIVEMMEVMKIADRDDTIRAVVLEGCGGYFCTGMDFKAASEKREEELSEHDPESYYEMLRTFSTCPKVVISKVEGKVNAGGVGLVAASDIVIAGAKATFGLSEALFGLLPACVMPFLIRRIGYQKALYLTLTTQEISAKRAFELGLVDDLSDNVEDELRKKLLRLTKIEPETVKELKEFMTGLWIMDGETKRLAVNKIVSLLRSSRVQDNIKNFVHHKKLPWEN